jgi:O-Antigen ligase
MSSTAWISWAFRREAIWPAPVVSGLLAAGGPERPAARGRVDMAATVALDGIGTEGVRHSSARSHAVPILQLFALTVMVIPSDTVIKAIGAQGYVAALVGMFAFAAFLAATLLGLHDPLKRRHPVRAALCFLWLSVLVSYVLMDRPTRSLAEVMAADRQIMQLAVITGVALVAAECLSSLSDVRRVLRALIWGGAFCGVMAALQFWLSLDVTQYLRELPGFSLNNSENPAIVARAALNRVVGTSITAIELGVVAGMLLPLAIYLAMYDTDRTARKRWLPVGLIALAIPASVSRSGIISIGLALAVLVVLMPARQRLVALCVTPLAVTGVFMSAPGVIGTLTTFFQAGSSDDSVRARLIDYPEVERLVNQAPWFGHGGGTYLPENLWYILDNQWLKTAIELGFVGIIALAAYFLVPLVSALVARRHSDDPELRMLCAALAGGVLAATVCSFTFDSLSFPMFSNVLALEIGLIGACWRLAAAGRAPAAPRARARAVATYLGAGRAPPNRAVLPGG